MLFQTRARDPLCIEKRLGTPRRRVAPDADAADAAALLLDEEETEAATKNAPKKTPNAKKGEQQPELSASASSPKLKDDAPEPPERANQSDLRIWEEFIDKNFRFLLFLERSFPLTETALYSSS